MSMSIGAESPIVASNMVSCCAGKSCATADQCRAGKDDWTRIVSTSTVFLPLEQDGLPAPITGLFDVDASRLLEEGPGLQSELSSTAAGRGAEEALDLRA
jgi:hypothetical protein